MGMKKVKYYFNTHTLRFEKHETPFRVRLLRTFGFLTASLFTSFIFLLIAYKYFPSANEEMLMKQNSAYQNDFKVLNERVVELENTMDELENRDNTVYRSIFESKPIPDSVRVKEMEKRGEIKLVQSLSEKELIKTITNQVNNLSYRVSYQDKSYNELAVMVKNKEKLLLAIPAIQPVSNKDLNRIASGFGYRVDPVYKVTKFHAGLDFTAPTGTPIYATADGTIKDASFNAGGFGNHVIIDHGYGLQTLYGHMYKIKTKRGQHVKRGEVIGYVGSTGKSTGPHCHYEVHRNGVPVDPIYYFYNDLTPAQYDRILKSAAANTQSLD